MKILANPFNRLPLQRNFSQKVSYAPALSLDCDIVSFGSTVPSADEHSITPQESYNHFRNLCFKTYK